MTSTTTEGVCGATFPFTEATCIRPAGHSGAHRAGDRRWGGGPIRLHTRPKVKPPDPGRPLAPQSVPAPKFSHTEGQLAMDVGRDEWDALTEDPEPKP